MTDDEVLDELDRLPDTCTLDVADRGGEDLAVIGDAMGVTEGLIRILEIRGKAAFLAASPDEWDIPDEHPNDPYLQYHALVYSDLRELAGELDARERLRRKGKIS